MGKRYYCDYCQKSFIDTPSARWKHLNGLHHQRLKKQHYDAVEASLAQATTTDRNICKHFQRTGICPYGSRCKFAHVHVFVPNRERNDVSVKDWLALWAQKRQEPVNYAAEKTTKQLPPGLPSSEHLPPSLIPVSENNAAHPLDWGY
ncbi:zinc finger matrin-type protein 5-like isoform X2 [Oscarella lobularis]|uniref:zinc finger matrin-type protein 5-like isoform X2 n=1 Tax=Oscarella lobularis TaxID=121494 RepID=UPI00331318A2